MNVASANMYINVCVCLRVCIALAHTVCFMLRKAHCLQGLRRQQPQNSR